MILQKDTFQSLAIIVFFVALTSCTSVTNRSYSKPLTYVKLAAQEACLTAGCELVPHPAADGETQVKATRGMMWGLLAGQGGETIQIDLSNSDGTTKVTITSRKRAIGFLAQRHANERVAEFLDQYLRENLGFEYLIVESTSGDQLCVIYLQDST